MDEKQAMDQTTIKYSNRGYISSGVGFAVLLVLNLSSIIFFGMLYHDNNMVHEQLAEIETQLHMRSLYGEPGEEAGLDGRVKRGRLSSEDTSNANFGTAYIRWGTHGCNDGTLLYRGYAAGLDQPNYSGGQSLQCLPSSAKSESSYGSASGGHTMSRATFNLMGVTPRTDADKWRDCEGKHIPCTACFSPSSDVMTFFGSNGCPTGYKSASSGYTMSVWSSRANAGDPLCVTSPKAVNMEMLGSNRESSASPQLSFVWGSSSLSSAEKLITCDVCQKIAGSASSFHIGAPGIDLDGERQRWNPRGPDGPPGPRGL